MLRILLLVCQKSCETSFFKVIDTCFIRIRNFESFKNPFATISSLLDFTLDSEDLFCWYKQKWWLIWTMAAGKEDENHWDEWGLTNIHDERYINQFQTGDKFQTVAAADNLSLKISSHGTCLKWSRMEQSLWQYS